MARPFGAGFYGRHRYSRGTYAALTAKGDAASSAYAPVSRVLRTVAPFEAGTSFHAALSPLVGIAAYAEAASEFYVGASTSSGRAAYAYMSAGVSAYAPITPFANLAGAAEPLVVAAQVDSEVQSDSALFAKVATAFAAESPGVKNAAAAMVVSFSPFYAGVTPHANLAAYTSTTTVGYVGARNTSDSAAMLAAKLRSKAVLRRTWIEQGVVPGRRYGTGKYSTGKYATAPPALADRWTLQLNPQFGWSPQGERPPRFFGAGRFSAGRYSTLPPNLTDRWTEV